MNIEKMRELVQISKELQTEGVIGFQLGFLGAGFQVGEERLINEPNLQIKGRGSDDYPYEVFVQHEGFKIFAIIKPEQIKDFPQFKEQAKADLLKQLQYLEEDVDLSGMGEGEEHAS